MPHRTQIILGIICRFRVFQICKHRCVVRITPPPSGNMRRILQHSGVNVTMLGGSTHLSWEFYEDFCALWCSSSVDFGTDIDTLWCRAKRPLIFLSAVQALSYICRRVYRAADASSCRWASGPSPRDCPRPCLTVNQSIGQSMAVSFVSLFSVFTFTMNDCKKWKWAIE